MSTSKNDLGPILDDFIREFNCDPADREDLCLLLASNNDAILKPDAESEIERIRRKWAERSERKATQFASIVRRLHSRPDLQNANELILFFIKYAAEQQNARKTERDAKLEAMNASSSTVSVTPAFRRQRITKFAVSRSTTPSSVMSKQSFFAAKHIPLSTPQIPRLTGRAAGPSVVCEEELARHALMALQGTEGVYIIRHGNNHAELQLSDTLAVDDVLRVQLLRLLSIANAFLLLRHESQKTRKDHLARAFYTGLSEVLASYISLITFLYTKFVSNPGSLTCLDILLALSSWEIFLSFLSKFVLSCGNLKGMQIFNALYTFCRVNATPFAQQFLRMLLRPMIRIFHEFLNDWLVYGRLNDPGFQWMIKKRMGRTVKRNWANEYEIVNGAVPVIFEQFEGLAEKILVVGRTVALLEQMGLEDDDLRERQRTVSSVDSIKSYLCISETHRLWHAVKKLSSQISEKVSQNIVQKYNIHAHLLAVQQHYLLNDECFALTFYRKLKEETAGDSSMLKLDSQQASEAFHAAVQQCNSWPEKIALYANIEATCGLMMEFNETGSSRIIESPRDGSGFATIRLNYKADIPISIVLNESMMERYEKAFEFMWLMLSTDFELTATLQDHQCFMKNEPISDALPIVNIFTVSFARMSQLLSSLRFYVSHSVVSRLQAVLLLEMNNVLGDLDSIIEAHNRYLTQLEEGLFLNEESVALHNSFCSLFILVSDLLTYYASFRSEMVDTIEARERFNKQQQELVGKDFYDTKFFEQEEERIRLEELQQHLEEFYRPKLKTLTSKFVLLVRDVLKILLAPPRKMHHADLALLLDLTGFYQHCEI